MKKFADIHTAEELWERVETRDGYPFLSCGNQYGKIANLLQKEPSPFANDERGRIEVMVELTNVKGGFVYISKFNRFIWDESSELRALNEKLNNELQSANSVRGGIKV